MATKKKSDDVGGVPVKTDARYRHPEGLPVQAPATVEPVESTTKTPAKTTATKKGN